MTMSALNAVLQASIQVTSRRAVGIDNPLDQLQETYRSVLAVGTGNDQANEVFHTRATMTTPQTYDLAGGIIDVFGTTITMVGVVAVFVHNRSATNTLTMGGHANAVQLFFGATTHTAIIQPGQFLLATNDNATDWPVTAGTGDVLQFTGTNGETYDLIIVGRNA